MTKAKIDVFDNNGKTFDRYTVIVEYQTETVIFGMSLHPKSPQGFNQFCGNLPRLMNIREFGRLVSLEKLPQEVQEAIKERL